MSDLDVYQTAARAAVTARWYGISIDVLDEQDIEVMAKETGFRAAVDAARAPLLAEVERLKAQQAVAETQGYDLVGLQFELDAARAEVERLTRELDDARVTIRAFVKPAETA